MDAGAMDPKTSSKFPSGMDCRVPERRGRLSRPTGGPIPRGRFPEDKFPSKFPRGMGRKSENPAASGAADDERPPCDHSVSTLDQASKRTECTEVVYLGRV